MSALPHGIESLRSFSSFLNEFELDLKLVYVFRCIRKIITIQQKATVGYWNGFYLHGHTSISMMSFVLEFANTSLYYIVSHLDID